MDICKTCGFDKDLPRDIMIFDSNPLSLISWMEGQCEECGHQKDGSTIPIVADTLQEFYRMGRKKGTEETSQKIFAELDNFDENIIVEKMENDLIKNIKEEFKSVVYRAIHSTIYLMKKELKSKYIGDGK